MRKERFLVWKKLWKDLESDSNLSSKLLYYIIGADSSVDLTHKAKKEVLRLDILGFKEYIGSKEKNTVFRKGLFDRLNKLKPILSYTIKYNKSVKIKLNPDFRNVVYSKYLEPRGLIDYFDPNVKVQDHTSYIIRSIIELNYIKDLPPVTRENFECYAGYEDGPDERDIEYREDNRLDALVDIHTTLHKLLSSHECRYPLKSKEEQGNI